MTALLWVGLVWVLLTSFLSHAEIVLEYLRLGRTAAAWAQVLAFCLAAAATVTLVAT